MVILSQELYSQGGLARSQRVQRRPLNGLLWGDIHFKEVFQVTVEESGKERNC